MAIITNHIDFTRDFTQIPNTWVRDPRLSHRARGVLAVLMSHRDGWQTSTDYLVRNGKEGRDAIRKAIAELVDVGYLERVPIKRDGGGLAGSMYVTRNPQSDGFSGPQESAPRATGFQAVGFSGPQESPPKNTNTKEHQKKEHQKESAPDGDAPAAEVERVKDQHPAHLIAQRAYDATHGALKFMAVRSVAQWAIDKRGEDPARVEQGIADIHHRGKPVTRAVLDQWFDGALDRKQSWQMDNNERMAAAYRQGTRQTEQTDHLALAAKGWTQEEEQ